MPRAGWTLALLVAIYACNFVDRSIVSVLGQAIKADLRLSDLQLGLLGGLSFAVFYTGLGLPIARLAERRSRVGIIAVSTALWSVMTALCGAAQGFGQLLLARMGVGVGEAGLSPAAQALISDTVPASRRASALAVYSLGIPIGTLIGLAGGGWLAQALNWRLAFLVVGLPGLLLALLAALTLKEAPRAAEAPPPTAAVLARLRARPSGLNAIAGASLASVAGYGISYFLPAWYSRSFGFDYAQAGLAAGLISSLPAALSLMAGGLLADRLGAARKAAFALVPAAALVVTAPLYLGAFAQHDWRAATALLTVTALFQYAYLPPTLALLHHLVEPRMRATATAILFFCINLVGLGVGPALAGFLSDKFGLTAALSACALFYLWAAGCFFLGSRTLARDLLESC
jgi:predicted MFS family arabinose efflux permease